MAAIKPNSVAATSIIDGPRKDNVGLKPKQEGKKKKKEKIEEGKSKANVRRAAVWKEGTSSVLRESGAQGVHVHVLCLGKLRRALSINTQLFSHNVLTTGPFAQGPF